MKGLRIYLLLFFGLSAAILSYVLYSMPFWGHWCLPWYLATWGLITVLFSWSSWDHPIRRKWFLAATVGGILLTLGFPTFPLTFLLFVGFIPLLWMLAEIARSDEQRKGRKVMFYSYHYFILWNIGVTYWVTNTAFFAGIVAIGLNSFFMAGVVWIFFKLRHTFSRAFQAVVLTSMWLAFEYLHLHWELSWSWLNVGNAFAQFPRWVQWYEYTGTFGGTLWVWIANWILWEIIQRRKQGGNWKVLSACLISGIVIPILASNFIYYQYELKGDPLEVVSVQPNYEPFYEKFTVPQQEQLVRFVELSRSCLTEQTDYLLFPETSFGYYDQAYLQRYPVIQSLQSLLGEFPNTQLITGLSSYRMFGAAEVPEGKDLYPVPQPDGSLLYRETQNSAIEMNAQGEIQFYLKGKLVPGAEIFPYKNWLPFLKPIVESLGGSLTDWGSQPHRTNFTLGPVPVAPIICYESIFGSYVGEFVRRGAQALFVVTNDGWWDDTGGHKQHALFARLRAIEFRRPVVRSANMAWSCFIDAKGDITHTHEYGKMHCKRDTILANSEITFYARWGDIIARIACFTVGLVFLSALTHPIRKARI